MIDYLYEWFRYKTGKITLKEFEENTSVTKNLCRDFSKEKIPGTIYFEEVKKMIDNFHVIDSFLQFEFDGGSFYKFELLVRNTDGENALYKEGYSNVNKNILIKSWCVDSKSYYEKIKHEMITLANMTGARLYVTLDRKDNKKLVQSIARRFFDLSIDMANGAEPAIKGIAKAFASETSKVENSSKSTKTLMWDVDTTDEVIVDSVLDYIESKGQKPYILKTKKGYHIFCFRKFDHKDWQDKCCDFICDNPDMTSRDEVISYHEMLGETVSVKENALGLVYHPMKSEQEKEKTQEEIVKELEKNA